MTTNVDDFLEHYGVKGMRWGVTRESSGSSKGPSRKERRVARNNAILEARSRQGVRARKYEEAQGDFFVARTKKGTDEAERIMRKLEEDFFTSEDFATSRQRTSGERWANNLALAGIVLGAGGIISAQVAAANR